MMLATDKTKISAEDTAVEAGNYSIIFGKDTIITASLKTLELGDGSMVELSNMQLFGSIVTGGQLLLTSEATTVQGSIQTGKEASMKITNGVVDSISAGEQLLFFLTLADMQLTFLVMIQPLPQNPK